MAACASDADCAALVTGHWCVEAATCDAALGTCVAWPRCRVTPWIGCSEAAAQCVMALGPDGPAVSPPAVAMGPDVATGLAAAGMVAALVLGLAIGLVWRFFIVQKQQQQQQRQ